MHMANHVGLDQSYFWRSLASALHAFSFVGEARNQTTMF